MQFNKYIHTHILSLSLSLSLSRTHIHTHIQHPMIRMSGPDCVAVCNFINTHTRIGEPLVEGDLKAAVNTV